MNLTEEQLDRIINWRRGIDVDLTYRCPLQCANCLRQQEPEALEPAKDLSTEDFKKILNYYNHVQLSGAMSDPIHHPKFIEFITLAINARTKIRIETASSAKSKEWYIKAFKANPYAIWQFAIDGLPQDSHIYRKNQNGQKLFDIMLEAKKYLKTEPIWQYIVFRYNQHHVELCQRWAAKEGIIFKIVKSGKINGESADPLDDPLAPTRPEYIVYRNDNIETIQKFTTYEKSK